MEPSEANKIISHRGQIFTIETYLMKTRAKEDTDRASLINEHCSYYCVGDPRSNQDGVVMITLDTTKIGVVERNHCVRVILIT